MHNTTYVYLLLLKRSINQYVVPISSFMWNVHSTPASSYYPHLLRKQNEINCTLNITCIVTVTWLQEHSGSLWVPSHIMHSWCWNNLIATHIFVYSHRRTPLNVSHYVVSVVNELTDWQTNSMEDNFWLSNFSSASQEIHHIPQDLKFITIFTRAHHLAFLWATLIQCMISHPVSLTPPQCHHMFLWNFVFPSWLWR